MYFLGVYVNLALEEDLVHGGGSKSLVILGLRPAPLSQWETCSHLGLAQMNGMANLVLAFNFYAFCI